MAETTVSETTTMKTIPTSDRTWLQSGKSTCGLGRANPPPVGNSSVKSLAVTVQHAQTQNDCTQQFTYNVNNASNLLVVGNTDCLSPLPPNTHEIMQITFSVEIDPMSQDQVDRLFVQLEGVSLRCDDPNMTVFYDLQGSHHYLEKRQCAVFASSPHSCGFYCDAISSCTESLSVTLMIQTPPWDISDHATPTLCTAMFAVEWIVTHQGQDKITAIFQTYFFEWRYFNFD